MKCRALTGLGCEPDRGMDGLGTCRLGNSCFVFSTKQYCRTHAAQHSHCVDFDFVVTSGMRAAVFPSAVAPVVVRCAGPAVLLVVRTDLFI